MPFKWRSRRSESYFRERRSKTRSPSERAVHPFSAAEQAVLGQAVPTRAATAAVDAQRRMVRRRRPTGRLGQPSRPDRRAAQPRRSRSRLQPSCSTSSHARAHTPATCGASTRAECAPIGAAAAREVRGRVGGVMGGAWAAPTGAAAFTGASLACWGCPKKNPRDTRPRTLSVGIMRTLEQLEVDVQDAYAESVERTLDVHRGLGTNARAKM